MSLADTVAETSSELDLKQFPRISLCHQPTPIEQMTRLGAELGGPNLYIKRDDCTGLATGGNKTRKLEFLVGEAIAEQADMLVKAGLQIKGPDYVGVQGFRPVPSHLGEADLSVPVGVDDGALSVSQPAYEGRDY